MKHVQNKCDIVIVAGGTGSRYGLNPKQFESIQGQPLYLWSLNTFLNWPDGGFISLVVPGDWITSIEESFENLPVKNRLLVVEGGLTRQQSAHKGLLALLGKADSEWVMIHDAARPLVSSELINRLWEARASDIGGVVPAVEAQETVKLIEPKACEVIETLPRDRVRIIQTPQLLKKALLLKAYEKFIDFGATDDACLVERLGAKVKIVSGDQENVKVTFKEDKERVSNWLRDRHPSI